MERSCSIFEIRRSNILFWRTSRLRGNLSFEEIPCIFEEPCYLRTTSSKKASLSSLCGFEHREISMFDLRSGITKNSLSPTSDLRSRRSKNPHLRSSEPKNRSKIERKTGERERERGDFFERGGRTLWRWSSSIFLVRRTKNPSSIFRVGRTKNPSPSSTLSTRRTNIISYMSISSSELLDQWPPASLSYAEVLIFSPMFHLEDRFDRARPSTYSCLHARLK